MTTPPDIAPGRIVLLWRVGSYDGMMTGVGMLEGKPVYLDACSHRGGWDLKPEWAQLRDLLDRLLKGDYENIWDRLEREYDKEMNECLPRTFIVHALDEVNLGRMRDQHRQWQLHVGLNTDFFYDEQGRPRNYPLERRHEFYWESSQEYIKAHYWDATPRRGRDSEGLPVIGKITAKDLYASSPHRIPWSQDPRSEDLKHYQATWKPGDPVRLDW